MKIKKLTPAIFIAFIFISSSAYANEGMSAKFKNMASCLAGIKKSTGQKLTIITDTPNKVTGFLSNKKVFACEKKETGSQGTYVEGWYEID